MRFEDRAIGINYPPMHPFCRCTIVPTMEDTEEEVKENPNEIKKNYDCNIVRMTDKKFYNEYHKILNNCDNEIVKKVWERYEDKIRVADARTQEVNYCSGDGIHINASKTRKDSKFKKAYNTFFHESAHSIDYKNARKRGSRGWGYSATYKDGIFGDTIKEEVMELVNQKWKQLKTETGKRVPKAEAYYIIEKGIKGAHTVNKEVNWHALGEISDMLQGATKGKINIGMGHSKSYWNDKENLPLEAFAEMTAATITSPESLKLIKQYLPKSYEIYLEILENILGE